MRIWSLHPKYLDAKGLVALWRETLLAKNVLENKTKGYKNHPQLIRFKQGENALQSINFYLQVVWEEACKRNYNFDSSKFSEVGSIKKITVNSDQLEFEMNHLRSKLKERDPKTYNQIKEIHTYEIHPLFKMVKGEIESWERI
ncbi:pyrimidine dimer DNA glycosylase/endonuclease V [Labilibaculum sp. DW002]|uniref:Pyrimidine dimer DNA glycosylase/endonuclease V n=1 Tax=Paralabilibaculum antarcticum TaxID=2912572 RepID=A0ABT5VM82_9BACT|nr:pyrimidine dimer DNA glycosylase/endonuclease V [Labilibaculum sp. DW002]MDE5416546.1 pyrimidine dimer DNA glycosylase/endonuclease V [Labilibaculum sp. DW002]